MQQFSAPQSLHLWGGGGGGGGGVACSHSSLQCLLVSGMMSSLHPTSFLYYLPVHKTQWVCIHTYSHMFVKNMHAQIFGAVKDPFVGVLIRSGCG